MVGWRENTGTTDMGQSGLRLKNPHLARSDPSPEKYGCCGQNFTQQNIFITGLIISGITLLAPTDK
jgi:hypothetical protein